jgi:KDO2-lipid IV(A) lauroyltransferase
VRTLADDVFRNYARYMLDLVRLPRVGVGQFTREVVVHGWEYFQQARQAGRGVVLATGHIGNWDEPGAWLAAQGIPVSVPVERLMPERWNQQVQGIRRAAGLDPIPMESGVRRMFQVLKQNQVLGVLVDRPLVSGGVPVRFFDATTRVPAGAAKLALKTGATLLAAAAVRVHGRPTVFISPPLTATQANGNDSDVQAVMQRVMEWLEALIRQYPDQWYMFRDMWPEAPGLPSPDHLLPRPA